MLRKIISIILGIVLLAGAIFVAQTLISNNKRVVREVPKTVKTVFTQKVSNSEIPIVVKANGNLVASRKIEVFS